MVTNFGLHGMRIKITACHLRCVPEYRDSINSGKYIASMYPGTSNQLIIIITVSRQFFPCHFCVNTLTRGLRDCDRYRSPTSNQQRVGLFSSACNCPQTVNAKRNTQGTGPPQQKFSVYCVFSFPRYGKLIINFVSH